MPFVTINEVLTWFLIAFLTAISWGAGIARCLPTKRLERAGNARTTDALAYGRRELDARPRCSARKGLLDARHSPLAPKSSPDNRWEEEEQEAERPSKSV